MSKTKAVSFSTGIPPSVNHAYTNNQKKQRILTRAARAWKESARLAAASAKKAQGWRFNGTDKLILRLWVYWPDGRRRDTHNLHKLTADAFEGILYKDDKLVLIRDMDFFVDKQNPRIEIRLEIKEYSTSA